MKNSAFKGVASAVVAIVVTVVVIVGISLGVMWLNGTFKKETANFRGSVEATEQVFANGANRIASYDKFFNLCGGIQAKEATIKNIEAENLNPITTNQRKADNLVTLTALKSARSQAIAQYNADANKLDTAANFQASNLPYMLSENGVTVCA